MYNPELLRRLQRPLALCSNHGPVRRLTSNLLESPIDSCRPRRYLATNGGGVWKTPGRIKALNSDHTSVCNKVFVFWWALKAQRDSVIWVVYQLSEMSRLKSKNCPRLGKPHCWPVMLRRPGSLLSLHPFDAGQSILAGNKYNEALVNMRRELIASLRKDHEI